MIREGSGSNMTIFSVTYYPNVPYCQSVDVKNFGCTNETENGI